MKSLNDVVITAALGAVPRRSDVPSVHQTGRRELRLHFPLVWSRDGVSSVIVTTAIGKAAEAIVQYVLPGEALMVTGNLTKFENGIRCKMISSARLVTQQPTLTVEGVNGPLFALNDGNAVVRLRGHVHADSVAKEGRFHTLLSVRGDKGDFKEQYPVVTTMPLSANDGVDLTGHYTRYLNEEEPQGLIIATDVIISETLMGPATGNARDPRDRMRLHRLAQPEQERLSGIGV